MLEQPDILDFDGRLRYAIATRRLVQLSYNSASRIAEPHDYGIRQGTVQLLVYQLRSERPGRPGWRSLEVSRIERLTVLERTFRGSRGSAHRRHYKWDVLFARVE